MIVWGGFTDIWGKKRSERKGIKEKISSTKCRVTENSNESWEGLLKWTMLRNKGKQ